ncbi:hypothetical protein [Fusobacterium necrophorum]|uniref:hypothetical protein n=1 Tax=Fusobacterium necrophorum TaxID=859 RepID=UPI00370E9EE0
MKEDMKKITYYLNGKIKEKYHLNERGKREGEYILFTENGELETKGNYKDGIKDGKWEYKKEGYDSFWKEGKEIKISRERNGVRQSVYVREDIVEEYVNSVRKYIFVKEDEIEVEKRKVSNSWSKKKQKEEKGNGR